MEFTKVKVLLNRGEGAHIDFWRTSAGSEVGNVVEMGGRLVPIEVELSATLRASMADSVNTFRRDFGRKAAQGYIIHPGDVCHYLGSRPPRLSEKKPFFKNQKGLPP